MAPGAPGHLETTQAVRVHRDSHVEVSDTCNSLSKVQKNFCHLKIVLPDVVFRGIVIIIQMAKISPEIQKKLAPFGCLSAELHFNTGSFLRLRGSGAKYKEMLRIAALFFLIFISGSLQRLILPRREGQGTLADNSFFSVNFV